MTGQITIGDDQRMTVVTLPAEMVYRNASCVHDELNAALEPGVAVVVLDLTPTVFCDTAGLGKLVYAHRLATTHATSLRIVMPPLSPLWRSFTLRGFNLILDIYPTIRAALTAPHHSGGNPRNSAK